MNTAFLIAVMSGVTMLTRFLPFMVFRGRIPSYISYLGRVLPPAIIGMLVIYCLKDVDVTAGTHGIPELISALTVVCLHAWKRNSLLSILLGTLTYMILIQFVF